MVNKNQNSDGPGNSRGKPEVHNHKRGGRFQRMRKALKGAIRPLLVHRRTVMLVLTLVRLGYNLVRWWKSDD